MTPSTPTSYPARLTGTLDPHLSRWLWLVKWFLAIPHYVVLAFLWIAFLVVTVIAGFAILFTGALSAPAVRLQRRRAALELAGRLLRLRRASAPTATRRSPSARTDYPADFDVDYPEQLSRGLVLVKSWLLAIPHLIIIGLFTANVPYWSTLANDGSTSGYQNIAGLSLLGFLVVVAGVVLLFTGSYPRGAVRPHPRHEPLDLPRLHLHRVDARRVSAVPS